VYNYRLTDESECEFFAVAAVEEIPVGERLFLEIDQQDIVIFKILDEYFAIEDICSHDDGPLGEGELEGHKIICPRHGAHFDVRTGKAESLPAIVDIPAFPVRVVNGQIELGLPLEN
jgi:3-phenylpropionate/trans-cinnamate dioxygenase ferredoxin subunit